MRSSTTLRLLGLLGPLLVMPGCISFGGPNDVRNAIAEREDVVLDKEMGVTVGPVGVFMANTIAGRFLPIDMNGIDWVSYGEYTARGNEPSADSVSLRDLDLPGWERIVRICDRTEDVIVMVPEEGKALRKLLVVMREDETVRIVRAEGNLEKVIDRMLESDLVDDDVRRFLATGSVKARPAAAAATERHDSGLDELSPDQSRSLDQAMVSLGWL